MNYPATTKIITFSRPCKMGDEEVTHVELREPLMREKIQFEKCQGSELEKEMSLVSTLCNRDKDDLVLLPVWDYNQLVGVMNDFLVLPPASREAKWKALEAAQEEVSSKSDFSTASPASATGATSA